MVPGGCGGRAFLPVRKHVKESVSKGLQRRSLIWAVVVKAERGFASKRRKAAPEQERKKFVWSKEWEAEGAGASAEGHYLPGGHCPEPASHWGLCSCLQAPERGVDRNGPGGQAMPCHASSDPGSRLGTGRLLQGP